MADPFSLATGIVGILSFAAQITQALVDFGLEWKDAPKDIQTFRTELQSLQVILLDINKRLIQNPEFAEAFEGGNSLLLSELGPDAPSTSRTKLLLETCGRELGCLLEELKKRARGGRAGWQRFKSAFLAQNTRDAVQDLYRQCNILNQMMANDSTFLVAITKKAVKESRKEQQEWKQDSANKEILNWLSTTDYGTQLSDFLDRREEGTSEWLPDTLEFQQWIGGDGQTLFCQGIPGAGKTMTTSIVIDHLYSKYEDDHNIGIAYLYCNYRQQQDQKVQKILANLLKQLIQRQRFMPEEMKTLYERYKDKQSGPSLKEITRVLYSIIKDYKKVFILVDALDECQTPDGSHRIIFSELFSLQTKAGANLFATSRVIPDIRNVFRDSLFLEIQARDEDIQRYVDNRSMNSRVISRCPDLQEKIREEILKAVNGMFLLAELHMETLTNQFTRGDIEEALENLPRGEEGLNETYSQAMKRIEDQKASEKHAKKVLSWVIHARRPLSGAELLHAFSVKSGTSELNRKYIPELEDLVSICAGLITIDERSDIVRLVHYTTQEYFQRTQQMWFPHAERDIATACVTYLSFDTFDEGFCLTDEQLESRLQLNPFYDYTSRNWGYHVQAAFSDVEQLLLKLFQSDAKVTATAQALLIVKGYLNYSQRVPQQVTGMHLAAYFGMDELIKFLLMHEYSPHPKDSHGQTPIVWAAKNGNAAALRLLLEEGPDINAKDNDGWTALQHAIWNTELATVRLLLEHKADIMAKDNNGWTALHRAADSGREDMVQLIIGNESIDAENMTPEMVRYKTFVKNLVKNGVVGTLHDAITSGDETTVKLLVEKGANIEMKDDWKETALDKAASYGNEAIMQILLENGADMEARNFSGRTPIHSAAAFSKNSSAGLMMLLEHGSHIKAKDEKGQTPLHLAAYFGNEAAVRLLLGMEDIDIEAKDDAGLTPLMQAAADGHEATVQLLLQQNANPESEDCKGRTAILCAADGWVHSSRTAGGCATGRAAVARVLLEQKDVKPNAQDCAGRTALICATEHEEEEALTRVLLEYNVDVNTKDGSGKTALLHAAARGDETIVRLLLEKGAYVDPCKELKEAAYNGRENVVKLLLEYVKGESEEKWLATAQLCGAVEGGDEEVVRSLLERGVDVRNAHGVTLVVSAVEKGHEKILRLLLASGADVNFSSHDTLTPLVAAAYYGSVSMMKIILESGANIVSQGAQALEFAARKGNEEVVQLLLDSGADANEGRWFTALYWAIEGTFSKQGDSEPIVRLLLERGANIAAKYGSDRMTALHIAACGHLAVIELLVEKGADKEAKDSKGLTPLHWATQRGYVEAVRLLLELGADPNNVDIGTMTRITEHRTDSKTREDYVAAIQMIREARRVKSV